MGIYQRQRGNYMKRPRRVKAYTCPCGTYTVRGPLCARCHNTVPEAIRANMPAAVAYVKDRLNAQSNTR